MSADYGALRLKAKGDRARLDEILNMECRDKTRSKLARTLQAAPDFRFPSLAVAEMATSDAMADIHAGLAGEGGGVADMTFGLGIDAFAFARRASSVTAFDIVEASDRQSSSSRWLKSNTRAASPVSGSLTRRMYR